MKKEGNRETELTRPIHALVRNPGSFFMPASLPFAYPLPHGVCAPSHVTAFFAIKGEETVSPHPD